MVTGARRELFESLLVQTYQQLFHLALRLTGRRADAEDLLQESFVRAYRFFHRFDESLPFSSWLYRIMTNAYIDEMRRRGRLKASSLDEPHPETGAAWDVRDDGPSPEAVVLNSEMDAEIQEALNQMTPEFRVAVLLADMQGLSYEEISEVMNTSVGTVRSRIHRGRKQLRKYLSGVNPDKYKRMIES
ncbi:MAG: RNA polymerase subunit sigma-70 [Armatimonadota bacterium]